MKEEIVVKKMKFLEANNIFLTLISYLDHHIKAI